MGWQIRDVTGADVPGITEIYGWEVLHGTATFEIDPPPIEEMARRVDAVVRAGFPYVVAVDAERVLAYGYCSPYRPRAAYRYTVEDSIYVARDAHRQGIGRALLGHVIDRCTDLKLRQMIAVIGDSSNVASIGLHQACGFEPAGNLRNVGWKFERWLDSVLMQRALGPGGDAAP